MTVGDILEDAFNCLTSKDGDITEVHVILREGIIIRILKVGDCYKIYAPPIASLFVDGIEFRRITIVGVAQFDAPIYSDGEVIGRLGWNESSIESAYVRKGKNNLTTIWSREEEKE